MYREIVKPLQSGGFIKSVYDYDVLISRSWLDSDKKLHREDGPAEQLYEKCPNILSQEEWCLHGDKHRIDGPARIIYQNGAPVFKRWYYFGGTHREDGPAQESFDLFGNLISSSFWVGGNLIICDGIHDPIFLEALDMWRVQMVLES